MVRAAASALVLIFVVILSPVFFYYWNRRRNAPSNCTVVVGGGCIGLCTAYFLAQESSEKIVVVDAGEEAFSAASSFNSGSLLYSEFSNELIDFGKYSLALWKELGKNEEFRKRTGYRDHALLDVLPGDGKGADLLPDWANIGPEFDVRTSPADGDSASIIPKALGKWLVQQCVDLGVEIINRTSVVSAEISAQGTLKSIHCRTKNRHRFKIKCQNLIVAAGPWTPAVIKTLFPKSPINLQPCQNASDWIIFRNPDPVIETSIAALFLRHIRDDILQIVGRNDGTMFAIQSVDTKARLPAVDDDPVTPDPDTIAELVANAKTYVKGEIEVLSSGRAFRPVNESGMPVMAKIPNSMISKDAIYYEDPERVDTNGIFVCWGHADHGITLGLGSGRVMSQIVRGVETDFNVSRFGLPQ